MKIELTTNPSSKDAEFISQGLVNFNHERVKDLEQDDPETKFSIFVRDDENNIIGGLRATCFWNALHVELVWVSKESRGSGIGTKLMKEAETFAIEHGYELSLLESASWQAKAFYEKMGYTLMATLPDFPKGYATHFLTKRLLR
ncbi:MAG: GNAT family N-acetyltransferase [Candidatus Marinimicrobia bacterium]|nr:GNAT family N-acetyltransferase [Candidatus Neomarinimicrobiota bacterium]MBT3575624.1 GNAT family N-acetyltransferase [Candidatus Neomarinimicrobiota bacterium]MBT4035333.1 GNAT family N-acetyltransferase [Candidatus Neomarinimicrobiota bacterium]MBT4994363.1 GNAT family N-acetyltransferase [Candidatus Neomarinimicrobiota bacterium]MBT5313505.1 GNAT family N-acetyltransferase [Candidatus Neomarinimicrobiota bacterium]